jgi:hypothetical protein
MEIYKNLQINLVSCLRGIFQPFERGLDQTHSICCKILEVRQIKKKINYKNPNSERGSDETRCLKPSSRDKQWYKGKRD